MFQQQRGRPSGGGTGLLAKCGSYRETLAIPLEHGIGYFARSAILSYLASFGSKRIIFQLISKKLRIMCSFKLLYLGDNCYFVHVFICWRFSSIGMFMVTTRNCVSMVFQ